MANKIDLENRVAVVTGGAQGFGRAITERFVASGAKVAIWDRDFPLAEKTAGEIGRDVKAIACDVTDPQAVEKARDATLEAFGRIDILVNNAGIAGPTAKLWEYSLEELQKTMKINFEGPWHAGPSCGHDRAELWASSISPRLPVKRRRCQLIQPRKPR